jgi:hypothetical protein
MSDARYAPPHARLRSAPTAGPGGTIEVGEALKEGWAATWSSFGLLLGVYVVGTFLFLLSALTIVGLFLLCPVFVWGFFRFNLNAIDGRAEFADLFSGFADYGRVVGTMLLLMGLLILVGLLGQSISIAGAAVESGALQGLGILVNFVWTMTVMPRLAFAWYYAVDREAGPAEALQAAWAATDGQTMTCIVLTLLSSVVMIMGVLFLLVGVIPAVMVAYLMQAAAFRQLAGQQTGAA